MGLSRLVELRSLGPERLERGLGSWGLRLWELAHGRDDRGVVTSCQAKSVSAEETFAEDISQRELLAAHLLALSIRVGSRLARSGLAGSVVTVKLKHSDFKLVTRRATLDSPSQETGEIYRAALALLTAYPGKGPFRLIGVGVSELVGDDSFSGGLFDRARLARAKALTRAEQSIRRKFGDRALTRAGALPLLGKSGPKVDNEPGSDKS
jgi:DNA polymerase-4